MPLPEEQFTSPDGVTTENIPSINTSNNIEAEAPAESTVKVTAREEKNISKNTITSERDTNIQIVDTYVKNNDIKDSFLGEFTSLEQYIHDLPEADARIKPAGNLIMDAIAKLKERRLILLDGFHGPTLDTVATYISYDAAFLQYGKKIVYIDDFSSRLEKFSLHDFIYGLAAKLKDTLLTVYIESGSVSALAIKELLILGDTSRSKGYKQVLDANNVFCIFLTWNTDFIRELSGRYNNDSILRCSIPWMPYMLHRHFLQEECDTIYNDIELLRRLEFWNYEDDFSFFKEIEYAVKMNTLKSIIEEGKDWERKSPEERTRLKKERMAVTSPARIFEKQNDLILYITFVVTYFPDLTVNDFRELIEILLEGETESEEVPTKESAGSNTISIAPVTSLVPSTANHSGSPAGKTITPRFLIEKWKSAPDSYLQKAGIRAFYSENKGSEVIDFEDGNFRAKCKTYLESHYFITVQKLFDKLYLEKKQLFVWEEKSKVFSTLVNLACYFANKDPDYYCIKLLLASTVDVITVSNKELIYQGNISDSVALWQFMEAHFEFEELKKTSLGQVSKLIIGMLAYTRLVPKVNEFFTALITRKQYEFVLELLSKLPPGTPIDVISWIRIILNNGPYKIKETALDYLINRVMKTPPSEATEDFKIIWSWVTRNEKLSSDDSCYGLVFIITYLSKTINQLPYEDYGRWPSNFQLYKNAEQAREWNETLDLLFKWVTHKELEELCRRIVKKNKENEMDIDPEIEFASFDIVGWQAATIGELFFIVNGLEPSSNVVVSGEYSSMLKEKVRLFFTAKNIKKMKEYWAYQRSYCLGKMSETIKDPANNKLWKARRQHITTILKYFM